MNLSLNRWWLGSALLAMSVCVPAMAQSRQVSEHPAAASASKNHSGKSKKLRKPVFGKRWTGLKKKTKSQKKNQGLRKVSKKKTKGKRRSWPKARPKEKTPTIPPLGPAPYGPGERLLFKVRMFNGEAGEVLLAVGEETKVGRRKALPVVGFIRSSPFLDKIYPVRDRMVVLLDEKTHLPFKTDFYVDEKGRKADYHTTFDHRKRRVETLRSRNGQELKRSFRPDSPLHEPLGSLYALRRMDLKAGDRFIAYIWDGRKERQVKVSVVGQELVWTPAGTFESMRIDVETTITGGYIDPKEFKSPPKHGRLWLANDRYRTPVKALTPTKIGIAEAILVRRYVETNKAADTPSKP